MSEERGTARYSRTSAPRSIATAPPPTPAYVADSATAAYRNRSSARTMNGASIDVANVATPTLASTSRPCRTIDCVPWPGVGPADCSDIAPRIQLLVEQRSRNSIQADAEIVLRVQGIGAPPARVRVPWRMTASTWLAAFPSGLADREHTRTRSFRSITPPITPDRSSKSGECSAPGPRDDCLAVIPPDRRFTFTGWSS